MAETEAVVATPIVEVEAEETAARKTVVAAPPVVEVEAEETAPAARKTVVVVALDDSEHGYYALEWTARHVAAGADLVVVHAKPPAPVAISLGGPAGGEVVQYVEADLRRIAQEVVHKARSICAANSIHVVAEVIDGEPRNVLCDAAEKHHADLLVVGSHGYGAIKRAFLGSVSDYCAHHAHCNVMIVKQPKSKK